MYVKEPQNLWSKDNYMQYPMTNHDGKEYIKKECVCIYTQNPVTLLYSRNEHNTVHQLYFDKTKTRKKRKRGTSLVAQWLRR